MWLFTNSGFYSIVQDHQNKEIFKVRARRKQDLTTLIQQIPKIENCIIHEDSRADYRYRIFINKDQLSALIIYLGNSINYSNFKDSIYQNEQQKEKLDSYHQVWEIMYDYQCRHTS